MRYFGKASSDLYMLLEFETLSLSSNTALGMPNKDQVV